MISDGECAPLIYAEALTGGSSEATKKCMEAVNSVPLDWTFSKSTEYRQWWDQEIPIQYVPDPEIPPMDSGGLPLWDYYYHHNWGDCRYWGRCRCLFKIPIS